VNLAVTAPTSSPAGSPRPRRVDGIDGIEGRVVACHDGPAVLVQADDGTRRWYPAETAARAACTASTAITT